MGVVSQTATPELTAHRKPLDALTGIRFFAAFYVVMFHTRSGAVMMEHGHQAAAYFLMSGYLAVPLFFLLSGFILAYTYRGQIERPGGFRRFWEARFARIWPVYALSLLLSSVPSFSFPPLGHALAALFMVQAWNPFNLDLGGVWNFVCWTLSAEAFFYLCFPWLQIWIERRKSQIQLLIIGFALLICLWLNSATRTLGYIPEGIFWWIPLPVLHLSEFVTGVGMGNYFLRRSAVTGSHPGSNILKGAGAWTYVSAAATIGLLCRPQGRWTSLVVVAFSALIFGLAAERTLLSRFLSTKTMLVGGGISYSIYLMQLPLKFWVLEIAEHFHVKSQLLRMTVTAVALILFCLFLFKFVEDPTRRLLRSLFAKLEQRRNTAMKRRNAIAS